MKIAQHDSPDIDVLILDPLLWGEVELVDMEVEVVGGLEKELDVVTVSEEDAVAIAKLWMVTLP